MTNEIVLGPVSGVAAIIIGFPVMASLVALILRYTSFWNRLERLYLDKNASFTQVFGLPVFRIISPIDPWGIINTFRHVFLLVSPKKVFCFGQFFLYG